MTITIEGNPIPTKAASLIETASRALAINPGAAGSAIADADRAFKRIIKRAEADASEEWERVEIVQHKGPTLGFNGKLLGEASFTTKGSDPMKVEFEIWVTQAGSFVSVSATAPADREGMELVNATVVEPEADVQAMRLKAIGHFDFHDRARNMARKMGWNLHLEVE